MTVSPAATRKLRPRSLRPRSVWDVRTGRPIVRRSDRHLRSPRRNATFAEVFDGGALSSAWYAAQLSVPRQLPELLAALGGEGAPLSAALGEAWRAAAGEAVAQSPYLYYHGGGAKEAGPALYMHYDAADNFIHLAAGSKEFWLYDPFTAAAVLYGSNPEYGAPPPVATRPLRWRLHKPFSNNGFED